MNKPAQTSESIHELLAERWSPRAFDPSAQISSAQLIALAEAARWAPSCYGDEPWAFVLCNRHGDEPGFKRALDCLAEPNQAWAGNSSLLILVAAKQVFRTKDNPNRHGDYDAGAAAISLVLQAEALGLRAHQMGGFDQNKARIDFAVPDGYNCIAMIAVGKQASPETLPKGPMLDMEKGERKRLAFSENFFVGKWGTSL